MNDTFADLTIFADDLPEVLEGAQLRQSLPTDAEAPGFEIHSYFPEFFIIIQDNDREFSYNHVILHNFALASSKPTTQLTKRLECWKCACVRMFEPSEHMHSIRISITISFN